jgi:L-amino acid N-acyltransferase YncA
MSETKDLLTKTSEPQNFVVRPALPQDITTIAALDRVVWGDWANPSTLYRQLIDLFPESIFVAHTSDGRYAGCAVGLVRTKPTIGWILSVDLAEEFRGKGLGKIFLSELLAVFRRLDVSTAVAIIDPGNTASQRLFSSFGFEQCGLEPDYFGTHKHQQRWEMSLG